jgi:hypothetical protein
MRRRSGRQQGGLTIVEALVSLTLLLFGISAALVVYDASSKSFRKGENVTEQQQGVRIAFDEVSQDLHMAGLNHNPDGDANRPDEQVEAAYDTAIVIRGDFDVQDPSRAATPETAFAGGAFDCVSTGNDEIVAYVLAKPDGSSADTLVFSADVKDSPRDGIVEAVSIPNVALVQDDPPYTLYRITLNNDVTSWGSAAFVVRTALIDNVRSLTFRYYDRARNSINATFNLSSTADDIGGGEAVTTRRLRSSISRIEVDLVGLTREPELDWLDPEDPDPETRSYRKFQLRGDITPRNRRLVGVPDVPAS